VSPAAIEKLDGAQDSSRKIDVQLIRILMISWALVVFSEGLQLCSLRMGLKVQIGVQVVGLSQ